MNRTIATIALAALAIPGMSHLSAQQTREQAIHALRPVKPSEMDSTFTKPAPFAQKLVDQALARHPEVLLLAIHAQPPHHPNVIAASNFDRIGKIGDDDDMRCIRTGKPNLEVNGPHFEDELVLKDQTGKTIGAIGVVFNYGPGTDKAKLIRIAEQIEREMQQQLPAQSKLFGPA